MKLWKILLATMIALVLVCAVAMAEDCAHDWTSSYTDGYTTTKHSATQHVTVGVDHQICKKCEETREIPTAEVYKDHEFVFVETVDPTCEKVGYNTFKCIYCGAEKNETMKPATGHSPVVSYVAATCKTLPVKVTACQYCNEVFEEMEYGEKAKCAYEVKGTVAPTCDEDGYNVYICKWCGDEKHFDIKPAAHKWVAGDKVAPTCTEKGYTNYACSVCDETAKFDYTNAKHDKVNHAKVEATCGTPGHWDYVSCKGCDVLWTSAGVVVKWADLVIPVNANLHEYNEYNGWYTTKPATCTLNGEEAINCIHCGHKVTRVIETKGHTYGKASDLSKSAKGVVNGIGYVTKATTCTEDGEGWLECKVCHEQTKQVTIPARGHAWGTWSYTGRATCTEDQTATRKCGWDGAHTETKVIAKATGHAWQVLTGTEPTCDKDGKVTRYCPACNTKEENKKIAALGCDYTKVVNVVASTCTEKGYTVVTCSRCEKDTKNVNYKDALGHAYTWVTTPATPSANGKSEYTCDNCGHVADTKTVKYTKWYYNNTMTSDGPSTRELVGGNDWYRVTPVDLTVDGVYTYDLVASNKYVVGTVTITVNAGTLTVSYKAKADVDVKDESLLIYTSKENLAAGSAVTAPVGSAINIAETFGAETQVLVSLILTGDYDAAGKELASK